jgi:hypothetical protein
MPLSRIAASSISTGSITGTQIANNTIPIVEFANTGTTAVFSPSANTIAFRTTGVDRAFVSNVGNVAIGSTLSPSRLTVTAENVDPFNTVQTHITLLNSGGNQGSGSRMVFGVGAATPWIQSFVSGANSGSGADLVFGTPSTGTIGTERFKITSDGSVGVTQTPGKYTVDVVGGATSIANNGTVDFLNASGMLVVNNYTQGTITMYMGGGGGVAVVSNTGGQVGTFAYVAGINGYRWTNNYGSTATFGFFFVRTRPNG